MNLPGNNFVCKFYYSESIADHMYRMSIISFLIEDKKLNKDKCIKIALVHDMAEAIVGDIAPAQNVSKEDKHKMEEAAMQEIKTVLQEKLGAEFYNLWIEYEEGTSDEGKIVKEIDKFEMIVQAFEYEKGLRVEKCLIVVQLKIKFWNLSGNRQKIPFIIRSLLNGIRLLESKGPNTWLQKQSHRNKFCFITTNNYSSVIMFCSFLRNANFRFGKTGNWRCTCDEVSWILSVFKIKRAKQKDKSKSK